MYALMEKLREKYDVLGDLESDAAFALRTAEDRLSGFEDAARRGDHRWLRNNGFITGNEANFMAEYDFGFNMLE
jgi:hypothetical protein